MSEVMKATFQINLPDGLWIAEISKKYSKITFAILSILPTEEMIGNSLIKITGPNIDQFLEEIKTHPSSLEFNLIFDSKAYKIINVKTKDPWLLISLIKSEVILKMPVMIKDGIANWEILAPQEKISTLNKLFTEKGIDFKLKSIGKYRDEPQLTARQSEVLDLALKQGYYEIPRKITLTQLADKLAVAKSTLSGILRRIDKKLVQTEISN